jgi:hypothetical protein
MFLEFKIKQKNDSKHGSGFYLDLILFFKKIVKAINAFR